MSEVHKVPTPELDRQRDIIHSGKAETVQEFIEWLLDKQGLVLGKYGTDEFERKDVLSPTWYAREDLMADFFGIDRNKIEAERRAILEALRAEQT
jgi:hypothetical protein